MNAVGMSDGAFMAADGFLKCSLDFGNMNIHSTSFSRNMNMFDLTTKDRTRTKRKSYEKICVALPDNVREYFVFLSSIRRRFKTKCVCFKHKSIIVLPGKRNRPGGNRIDQDHVNPSNKILCY
jgi:hypothetical protein